MTDREPSNSVRVRCNSSGARKKERRKSYDAQSSNQRSLTLDPERRIPPKKPPRPLPRSVFSAKESQFIRSTGSLDEKSHVSSRISFFNNILGKKKRSDTLESKENNYVRTEGSIYRSDRSTRPLSLNINHERPQSPPPLPSRPPPKITQRMPRRKRNNQPPSNSRTQDNSEMIRIRHTDHREQLCPIPLTNPPHRSSAVRLPFEPTNDRFSRRPWDNRGNRSLSTVFSTNPSTSSGNQVLPKELVRNVPTQLHNKNDFEIAANRGLLHVQKGKKLLEEGQFIKVCLCFS